MLRQIVSQLLCRLEVNAVPAQFPRGLHVGVNGVDEHGPLWLPVVATP